MYPTKPRTKKVIVKADRSILRQGFDHFAASIAEPQTGGGRDTKVILIIENKQFYGTSTSDSHAEMDALNQILIAHGEDLEEVISIREKYVSCTAKPCCYRCSIVLGLLGFRPANDDTKKTKRGMGQTQWVLPSPLKEKIMERYGDIVYLLSFYSNVDIL